MSASGGLKYARHRDSSLLVALLPLASSCQMSFLRLIYFGFGSVVLDHLL